MNADENPPSLKSRFRYRPTAHVKWVRCNGRKKLPANPAKEFATLSVTPLLIGGARNWLHHNLPKSRRVMVFVHGFNNRYEDAVYRFAQIVHDSNTDVAPVLSPGRRAAASLPITTTRKAPTIPAMRWRTCCVSFLPILRSAK